MHKSLRLVLLGCAASLVIGVTFTARAAAATANGQIMPSRSNTLPPAPSGTLVPIPQPPQPGADQIEAADPTLGNPIDKPITGAGQLDRIVGGEPPPSLEALQDMRPNDEATDGLKPGRREQLQEAAHIYGAQGGLAARAFAINEMLRRYEGMLDATYDFRPLVLPIGGGQTLMQPPIVTEAQMALALNDTGQVARETQCVFEITREAQLTSAAPNWRTYLVRSWNKPRHPVAASLPLDRKEVAFWNKWVAEGWADGEKQATEIFLSDLARLQRDIVGMARYRVLLNNGRVEQPHVVFEQQASVGGGDTLHVGDRVIRITSQPGLQGLRRDRGYGYSSPTYPEQCQ
ncbi:conjugal transfer protein TraI (plasmid) [Kozakia baliensis]|uniref:Conjugal transfer protein TraI n=4 Tax=Kozakia baliensis TaxID=153496 RepID=A0A1D8UXS1_9PROT|nr:type IV secretory system conjugative DNA transfer family protein [Kozakia baliensis]AOX18412.1 conjugal transfer protein TraI [Kozakia baliensis]GEL65147.1 hypothetical protein KBA01_24330 [Kozakia baliensis]